MEGKVKHFIPLKSSEIIVDSFAGGGGASTGIRLATGREVDVAINHDLDAILMHKTNHPNTQHYQADVWDVDPLEVCAGRPVGLLWASPDCFEAGTLILTASGYKPIEDIAVGDLVLTHKMRWRKVTATMETERDEMVVKGYGHPGLVCSTGHPFYVKTRSEVWNNVRREYDHRYSGPEWKKAGDLTKADYWGSPLVVESLPIPALEKPNVNTISLPVDERLLWLAGRYTGDGWSRLTDKRAEVIIVCGPSEIEYLRKKLNMWERSGKRCKDGELAWQFREVRTGGQFTCNSRSLVKWLRGNFGHLATGKQIPAWLMGAPENLKKAFVDGYVGADGHVAGKLTETSTVSKKLAFGMRSLMVSMGYSAMVYLQKKQTDIIEGRKVNSKPIYTTKWRETIAPKHEQTFSEDGILWSPIRNTVQTGNRKVFFNISVEEDESYIAEGVIVHNCKHFSKAKGGKPVDKNIRGLAWIVLRWAGTVRPRVIILENVEEFQTWGPVRRGRPIKAKTGQTFQKFTSQLEALGYMVEWRELVAADFGAPTTRKRFFLIARCDGQPIVWPEPTHAPADSQEAKAGTKKPWRSASEIIDWSLPTPSIFATKEEIRERYGVAAVRPLAQNTIRRVARGVDKFVIRSTSPFLVVGEKQTAFAPAMIQYHTERTERVRGQGVESPIMTIDASNRYGLAAACMVKYYGNTQHGQGVIGPLHTVTAKDRAGLTMTHMIKMKGTNLGGPTKDPLQTITAGGGHHGVVTTKIAKVEPGVNLENWPQIRAALNEFCGYALEDTEVILFQIGETFYFMADIGLRMLTPRELYRASGFPDTYIIDRDYTGRAYGKTKQVARCGNAVPPPFAEALVRANLPECCGQSTVWPAYA